MQSTTYFSADRATHLMGAAICLRPSLAPRRELTGILQLAGWTGQYAGNFMALLEGLDHEISSRGYRNLYAFPESAAKREWAQQLATRSTVAFLKPNMIERIRAIRETIQRNDVRLVHSHFSMFDIAGWLAARSAGVPVVWHFQSQRDLARTLPRRTKDLLKYAFIGKGIYAIAVSPPVREWIVSRGLPRDRCVVVENCADLGRATILSAQRESLRADLGIGRDRFCLVMFGSEPHRKGVDVAIAGLVPVAAEMDLCMILVASHAAVSDVQSTLGGPLPTWIHPVPLRETVGDFYAIADAFLSASRLEGMPFAVIEAMAAGKPIISSDIPHMDWARGIPSVAYFAISDPRSLAGALRAVRSWPSTEMAARVAVARAAVDERYSVQAWARNIAALYEQILHPA